MPPNKFYLAITHYLLFGGDMGFMEGCPDSFLYSEELILAPRYPGHMGKAISRLSKILRPQDRVVVSTRHPKDVLFSRYCERYHELWSYTFRNAVMYHPLFEPYDYLNYKRSIPTSKMGQFEFMDFNDVLAGESNAVCGLVGDYFCDLHENTRLKIPGQNKNMRYKVSFVRRRGHFISIVVNNLMCMLFNEVKDPLLRFPFLVKTTGEVEIFIKKPLGGQELNRIRQFQEAGLMWLKESFGVDYLDFCEP